MLALTTRPLRQGRTVNRIRRSRGRTIGRDLRAAARFRVAGYDEGTPAQTGSLRESARRPDPSIRPRSVTDYLVRRTLAPLVRDAAPEQILGLRVLDPAMGSGAFLVSACRYLAAAYESALLREGGLTSEDIEDADRAGFRRAVAQRCLFGVDINPMAVQVGRLSLWLTTLAADRPLTFLDHRLRTGNSLIGASLEDLARQPPSKRRLHRPRPCRFHSSQDDHFDRVLCEAVDVRWQIANGPGDTLEQVRMKEQSLNALTSTSALAPSDGACRPVVQHVVRHRMKPVRFSRPRSGHSQTAFFMARTRCRSTGRANSANRRGPLRPPRGSFTGRSSSPRSSSTTRAGHSASAASTPSSATRHGKCFGVTMAMPARAHPRVAPARS